MGRDCTYFFINDYYFYDLKRNILTEFGKLLLSKLLIYYNYISWANSDSQTTLPSEKSYVSDTVFMIRCFFIISWNSFSQTPQTLYCNKWKASMSDEKLGLHVSHSTSYWLVLCQQIIYPLTKSNWTFSFCWKLTFHPGYIRLAQNTVFF